MYDKILFIFHRDLRIDDNLALLKAIHNGKRVYTAFIFDPIQVSNTNKYKSDNSIQFMMESLDDLRFHIEYKKGHLGIYYGETISILKTIVKKLDIDCVCFNEDITPFAIKRTNKVKSLCKQLDIDCLTDDDYYLYAKEEILTGGGEPYTKFTPYYNKVVGLNVNKPKKINSYKFSSEPHGNYSLNNAYTKLITPNRNILVNGGRTEGLKILNNLKKFTKYGSIRNKLSESTTHLSAYLKYGCLSVRETYYKMVGVNGKGGDLVRQLIWREFYAQILYNFPEVLKSTLKPKYNNIKWVNNRKYLNAWKQGKTGFPIVDAGMRELNTTGYMHNRSRLITSSFLVKTLLINWKEGEKYFAQKLNDYDVASNNGNWQWVMGGGADSQPYFRIFNPSSQSSKHDPDAEYIKKWVPELEKVDPEDIHDWEYKYKDYENIDYPSPIVDYKEQREKILKMYKEVV